MVLGIDLGTTFCAVAYVSPENGPIIIPNANQELTTPSVIWSNGEEVLIGKNANNRRIDSPNHIIEYIKREIGKSHEDFTRKIAGTDYDAEELSAVLLYKLALDANMWLMENGRTDQPISDVIITVPAYFDDLKRNSTQRAGELAGLNVMAIINEPTAAAISYGFELDKEETVMVFDLGGGTFDVTLMKCKPNRELDVLLSDGDMMLGGKDWDSKLVEIITEELTETHGLDNIPIKMQHQINEKARQVKLALTDKVEERVLFSHNGYPLAVNITRQMFEMRSNMLLAALRAKCEQILQKAKKKFNFVGWGDIDHFVLVGGATRMPMILKLVNQIYDGNIIVGDVDLAIAKGAALHGQDINRVIDISSKSLGVLIKDEHGYKVSVMIEKDSKLPCSYTASFTAPPQAKIKVMQGEGGAQGGTGPMAAYYEIGIIELNNPIQDEVDVTYSYNTNGVVVVTYKDSSGKVTEIPITPSISNDIKNADAIFNKKKEKVNQLIKMISF